MHCSTKFIERQPAPELSLMPIQSSQLGAGRQNNASRVMASSAVSEMSVGLFLIDCPSYRSFQLLSGV